MDKLTIKGARTHNLKNIDLTLPRNQLIVITGLSGSGKSSLAFDTLYAEGQRRYVESLSAYARQFLSMMEKPEVDHIEGLSPAISIEQKSTSHNPRSTVGTITEIYDYLRLLYARVGEPYCPEHQLSLKAQTISQMVDILLAQPLEQRWMLLAPVINQRKGEHLQLLAQLKAQGFIRARINGDIVELDQSIELDLHKKHTIEVVIDRFKIRSELALRLAESLATALRIADGIAIAESLDQPSQSFIFSEKYACVKCGYSIAELEPRLFSFNNPKGACPECDGLGVKSFFDPQLIVTHPDKSVANGAISGWDKRSYYSYFLLQEVAEHCRFDLNTPFQKLTPAIQHLLLYGSESLLQHQALKFSPKSVLKTYSFDGIIPIMQRRYRETDSETTRDELAHYLIQQPCPSCQGTRLNIAARHVFIQQRSLAEISALSIQQALTFFQQLQLEGHRGEIADKINREIQARLAFLVNVGLAYLSLNRSAETLSGGEAQRIRLASQIGAGLVGVMYVLDEPSIGLHQRDNQRLLDTLFHLRDLGNTVIVVEHDEDAIRAADYVVDMGVGAGVHGGEVVAQGQPESVSQHPTSLTGQYLSGRLNIDIPSKLTAYDPQRQISIRGASGHNLKHVEVHFPIGLLTCVTGVSGSGKSTLVNDTLYLATAKILNQATVQPQSYQSISGLELLDKVIDIDQSPIGRTPRSNPATYTGIFTQIRELFAATPEARSRGYAVGRFSFNVKGGRCEACAGDGVIKVEMHFLADIFVTCEMCQGQRYNRETLDIRYKGKNIHQVLAMTIEQAKDFFQAIPALTKKLQTLIEVGLSYLTLGQNAVTLSGGEAQRVKLAKELSKRDTGKTLYILDEPTTGLHFHDIKQLLVVLHRLRDHGNTIIVIEHHLDVIKTADWIIDLGPEGGDAGGKIVACGTPSQLAAHSDSYTGYYLRRFFSDQTVDLKQ